MSSLLPLRRSAKLQTTADIVFCIDSTGSMIPCIKQIKEGLVTFVHSVQSAAEVDFRIRLIAYRDLHDPSAQNDRKWFAGEFTPSADIFQAELSAIVADGGGDHRGGESTLDALYMAVHSAWRSNVHKSIVVVTDDDTHPTLHPSTYNLPDNDSFRVIQDLQTLANAMLFLVVPRCPLYQQMEQAMNFADRKVFAYYIPYDDSRYADLNALDWQPLLKMIGETISRASHVTSPGRTA